jgi:perosamine synthetase
MPRSSEPGALAPEGVVPLCVPEIRGNEWRYVKECLDSNWVSSAGAFVDRFESELASRIGARHAVATVNGTAALHTALLVAGVRPDDEVLVSTLSFVAPANAVRYVGAWPVFVDSEPAYWQMDPHAVADFAERRCRWRDGELRNRVTGRRVSAIVPVHILGHPVDLDPILAVARRFGLAVVEDATESLAARYKGRELGTLGDIGCFSFNGNKLITAGGGGMIVTAEETWARRARYLTTQAKDDPIESIHGAVGYNYRLSNVHAALGCGQLERLDEHVATKRRIAGEYARRLGDVPGITPMPEAPWAASVFWMYTVLVDERRFGADSRAVMRDLDRAGVQTRPLWQPCHRSPAHAGREVVGGQVAEDLHRRALSLPCSVGLTPGEQERVVRELRSLAARPARGARR